MKDWTEGVDGRSNSSELFMELTAEVGQLIRANAHELINGSPERVARTILAHLAHKRTFGPLMEAEKICSHSL